MLQFDRQRNYRRRLVHAPHPQQTRLVFGARAVLFAILAFVICADARCGVAAGARTTIQLAQSERRSVEDMLKEAKQLSDAKKNTEAESLLRAALKEGQTRYGENSE